MQEWEKQFNSEFFNSADDVAEFYCCNVRGCNVCGGGDENGEPNGYGCQEQEDFIKKNLHKVLSERVDAIADLKAFIQAQIDKAVKKELTNHMKDVAIMVGIDDFSEEFSFFDIEEAYKEQLDKAREEGELNMLEYSKDGLETIHQTWDLLVSPKDHIERQIKLLNKHIKQLKTKHIKE